MKFNWAEYLELAVQTPMDELAYLPTAQHHLEPFMTCFK